MPLDFATLDALRSHHPAWRLLRSDHAALVASFLHRVFVTPNVRGMPAADLAEALEDELYALRLTRGEDAFPKAAIDYLDDWAAADKAWLRKYYKPGTDEVIKRLKAVAPKAEKAGVILGIESWLSAEAHMDIIQRIGSPAVQVYYDVCNSNDRGYDIYKEIRWLGAKHICEFHMKENGALLGQGKVDFKKVRAALDDIGYAGWMQIEGAVPKGAKMLDSYKANLKFLRDIFPKDA